jgi:hypothetical protein
MKVAKRLDVARAVERWSGQLAAKRLLVLAANLNEMQRHRQQIVREWSATQKRAATSLPH